MRKFLKALAFLAILAAIGFCFWQYYQQQNAQASFYARPPLKLAQDGTSTSPAAHSQKAYEKLLDKNYPDIYDDAFNTPATTKLGQNVVVPGLLATKSLINGKLVTSRDMTPQGLTIAGPYLLISAYDGAHKHNSVVYCLSKKTGRYVKTIQITGRPHLGGLAYDPNFKNIWLTGENGDGSVLMSFSLKELQKYQKASAKPIRYNNYISLPTIERASTVTYFDRQLFVGYFNKYEKGKVASYPIDGHGSIVSDTIKAAGNQASWSDGAGSTSMDRQIQGIAFNQNLIFLSQSYGSGSSKLYIFPVSALNSLDEKNAQNVIELPPYLEQIYLCHGQLLMLFEGGARQYQRNDKMVMDRVLSVNVIALLGN